MRQGINSLPDCRTVAKRSIAPKSLILQLKSILSLLKPMETINLKEEVRSLIDKLPENFTWPDLISAVYLKQAMKSEPIQVKGIKQGKNIQLSENINIPDGSLVLIEVREVLPINNEEKWKRMKEFLVSLSDEDREEWRKIAEFLEGDRTTNRKPKPPPAPPPPPPKHPKKRREPLFGCDREVITIGDNFDEPLEDFQDYM
jgi:predicted DNA-binding antitoxin AbrB/MazE fold protein